MQKTTKITAGIVALGLTTPAFADDPNKITLTLAPKSCLWMGSGADHFKTVASGKSTLDTDSGTTWKCNNGAWSQVRTPPPKKGTKGAKT